MEQGTCPVCESNDLNYGVMEVAEDDKVFYTWTCDDCEATGEEWYNLRFSEHVVITPHDYNLDDNVINA